MNNTMKIIEEIIKQKKNYRLVEVRKTIKENNYYVIHHKFKLQVKRYRFWITFKSINCNEFNIEAYHFNKINSISLFDTIVNV